MLNRDPEGDAPAARRWTSYVLASATEDSQRLWASAASECAETVLVCGVGFDPRTLDVAMKLRSAVRSRVRVLALELPGDPSSAAGETAARHRQALEDEFGAALTIVPAMDVADRSTAGPILTRLLVAEHGLLSADHVVIDMSALPSSVSFPIIRLLLVQSEPSASNPFRGDLQVCVSEDPSTDACIQPTGFEEPDTLAGFLRLPDDPQTRVWVPILGEGRSEQLRAVRDFLQPHEVCPVVPFPARTPRRGDDLLLEHRLLLFEDLQFDTRNVLYASERNPFDVYRQLCDLAERYRQALRPLGGATIILSQHSSKLLSLGGVLAAHEAGLAVAHVRPTGYALVQGPVSATPPTDAAVIHTAWLAGRPYVNG